MVFLALPLCLGACSQAPIPSKKVQEQPAMNTVASPSSHDSSAVEFAVPAWYTADVVENLGVIQQQKTVEEADGSYMAFMLFEMKAEHTPETCLDLFRAKIAGDVELGATAAVPQQDGQLQFSGETATYTVSVVCGEAKGKQTAFLSLNKKPSR